MAGVSPEALAGYILEEMLAYLLRNAGYRLLTDASQDPHELANQHHGLVVHGRGADHQADVLGELLWIPAFTFPLRLVLEAKCRKGKTDIGTVRSMVAALLDINQNNMPNRTLSSSTAKPRPKYTYVGAIFSASGFSKHAADFALAHAISLVDLRAPEFQPLLQASRQCGQALSATYQGQRGRSAAGFVGAMRQSLRVALRTGGPTQTGLMPDANLIPEPLIAPAIERARNTGELFIGMASGPYMLVLKADDPQQFIRYAATNPTHSIHIHWSRRHDNGQTWTVTPATGDQGYRLTFKLPEGLSNWIFGSENVRRAAATAKETFLSSITIYRKIERRDQLIRLTYDPRQLSESHPHDA